MTIDVAFISLRHILPALPPFLERRADIVALVKPQFEAGRDEVGKARSRHRSRGSRRGDRPRDRAAAGGPGLTRVAMAPVGDHRRHRQPGVLPALRLMLAEYEDRSDRIRL